MSGSDRSEGVALVAVCCTIVIFLIGLWAGSYYNERYQEHATRPERPNLHLLKSSPPSYQAVCNSPIDETHADLCQQWRAAEAATQSANWAFWQFMLGAAGLVGLVVTVVYARRAFIQTKIQATAALRANARATRANVIARESSERQLRAYMTVEKAVVIRFGVGVKTGIEVVVSNNGQTPARSFRFGVIGAYAKRGERPVMRMLKSGNLAPSVADIGAGKHFTLPIDFPEPMSLDLNDLLRSGDIICEVGGYASYRDVFNRRRIMTFHVRLVFGPDGATYMHPTHKHNRGT